MATYGYLLHSLLTVSRFCFHIERFCMVVTHITVGCTINFVIILGQNYNIILGQNYNIIFFCCQ